jgi:Na+-transporting NADH:ubiquinone oxidoreductase subunit A
VTLRALHERGRIPDRPSVRIRRGLDLRLAGEPDRDRVEPGPPVSRVAVLGADAPGVRPALEVEIGARVRLGQTLFTDRRHPPIRFTSPGAGVVEAIERGPRRRLEAVVVRLEGDEEERFEPVADADLDGARVRAAMQASGLWTALRTRPFSRIPDPDASPRALFVTALASEPLAPDPAPVITERAEDFRRGVAALATLTEGPVFVCSRPGAALPATEGGRVRRAEFAGPHPAGLPGTHIHHLAPAAADRVAWHVGHADVLALGALLATGRLSTERVVALAGPAVARPRLVRTRLGASTEDLLRDALHDGTVRVISGSVLSGRRASGWAAYLGRGHAQVCAVEESPARSRTGWVVPGWGGRARRVPGVLGRARPWRATTALGGRRGTFFPLERMERAFPLAIPLAPLLRALLVGDVETAREIGCLELDEEDLALASFLCPAKLEYGALLRAALDEIEKIERQQP